MKNLFYVIVIMVTHGVMAQNWQQRTHYTMEVHMDDAKRQFRGTQSIVYENHSPDSLKTLYYHLYLNAFSPNSEMDLFVQTKADPDPRMVINQQNTNGQTVRLSKIAELSTSEQGYLQVENIKINGQKATSEVFGTILKVKLPVVILPHSKAEITLNFKGQVPPIIRRMGYMNADGIPFSMAQWFPKMAVYDHKGWHTPQYVSREFYGNWGNFDVKINLNENYTIAGTGVLQEGFPKKVKGNKKQWHFKAQNVHDFAWSAATDFQYNSLKVGNKTLHFYYRNQAENWKKIQPEIAKVFAFFEEKVGAYPWSDYSFIQAGDGGMEYAMCTFIMGGANYNQLLNTAIHELAHAWFQHIFASDEVAYPWLDEGFTSYLENWAKAEVIKKQSWAELHQEKKMRYLSLVHSGLNEPAITNANTFKHNRTYNTIAYAKGYLLATHLGYLAGQENLEKAFKRFYQKHAFTHPTPYDFVRCLEEVSNLQLMWFLEEYMHTTHHISYGISGIKPSKKKNHTLIALTRMGEIPVSVELKVKTKNQEQRFYIPTILTLGDRPLLLGEKALPPWGATNPSYVVEINAPMEEIISITIDPDGILSDLVQGDNELIVNPDTAL